MKKLIALAFTGLLFSCSSETKDANTKEEPKTEPAENLTYAYTLKDQPADNWDRGDQKNIVLVLNSLRAFENNNMDECVANFADSVQLYLNEFEAKLPKDSARVFLQNARNSVKSLVIEMEDYETVISKDKKREWVSLWYKEKFTNDKGVMDSIFYMDDVRIIDGKIATIDEKSRKYAKKK